MLNVKVILINTFNAACLWKGHDLSNNVCVSMKLICWPMKKLSEENETLTQIVYDAGNSPAQQLRRINQSINQKFRKKTQLKTYYKHTVWKNNDI